MGRNGPREGEEHYMAKRRHHRYRRHRNPVLGMSGGDLIVETGAAVVNGVATRVIPQMVLGSSNSGLMGYGANAITGLAGAWLAAKFSQKAGHGALLGAAVAIASRILSDTLGQNALGGGLSGDMGGELGFYINNSFPLPTGGSGPLLMNPGYSGMPMNTFNGASPSVVATAAGSQAVSPGGAGASNAALATASGPSSGAGVWSSPWAA